MLLSIDTDCVNKTNPQQREPIAVPLHCIDYPIRHKTNPQETMNAKRCLSTGTRQQLLHWNNAKQYTMNCCHPTHTHTHTRTHAQEIRFAATQTENDFIVHGF